MARLQNGYNLGRLSGLQIDPPNPTDIRRRQPSILLEGSLAIFDPALLPYIKAQLGHSSIRLTVDTYAHLVPGANRQAVNKLPTETGAPLERLEKASGE